MEVEGLSAQKNVHVCTFFCAYGNPGIRIRGQVSPVEFALVKQIQTVLTPMEYKFQMHSIGHAG